MPLSAFLRPTLQPDPMRELRFAEEIALRKEYRDIEKERGFRTGWPFVSMFRAYSGMPMFQA